MTLPFHEWPFPPREPTPAWRATTSSRCGCSGFPFNCCAAYNGMYFVYGLRFYTNHSQLLVRACVGSWKTYATVFWLYSCWVTSSQACLHSSMSKHSFVPALLPFFWLLPPLLLWYVGMHVCVCSSRKADDNILTFLSCCLSVTQEKHTCTRATLAHRHAHAAACSQSQWA